MSGEDTQSLEPDLLARARSGDFAAFAALVTPVKGRIVAVLRRMIGNPDDVADVFQDSLTRAWGSLSGFRGDARFSTWLQSIAVRQGVDFLRAKKRYRAGALLYAQRECERTGAAAEVMAMVGAPDFHFDVNEHIAYCFSCVGRSLEPDRQAALLLREVYELSNEEAAEQLGVTRSRNRRDDEGRQGCVPARRGRARRFFDRRSRRLFASGESLSG